MLRVTRLQWRRLLFSFGAGLFALAVFHAPLGSLNVIEARQLSLEPIPFSPRDHIDELLKPLTMRAAQKDLELICHVLPAVPTEIVGDPGRLRQVLLNLVGNAIKFAQAF
jgi:signal transduction histidine kinase